MSNSPFVPNPFASLSGWVAAGGPDAGTAGHYGNPSAEQRALAGGRAIVDLGQRGIISISGADRLTWIDSISSQSVAQLAPGNPAETLFLDPNGRLEYAASVIDDGDTLWLIVDGASAAPLLAWLLRMRFMLRVEPADRSAEFAVVGWVAGSAGTTGLVAAAAPHGVALEWRDPWGSVVAGGHQYAGAEHPSADWAWTESIVSREDLAGIVASTGSGTGAGAGSGSPALSVAGSLAVDALRVAAWRPRFATEADDRTIPHELDWLRTAVHLNKGCYRGQETVAKVHNLGHPPRRLVMLHLDGSDNALISRGDDVTLDGVVVGHVTTPAQHFELGPIALAVIKRSVSEEATLTVSAGGTSVAAAQEIIVPVSAGAVASVPRIPRLGAVSR